MWGVIAGGGTAGHVLPGIAIGHALVARGHDPSEILYVGSESGIDGRLVPAAGFEITLLPGRGIERRLTARNAAAASGIARATARCIHLLRQLHPSVVLSLGGYASVPCAVAAAALRIPVVVHEQNAVPGAANRLAGRFARACAVSFPGTKLPRAVLTGNPVRPEVLAVDRRRDRASARAELGVASGRTMIAAYGGSLGARRINEAVLEAARRWAGRADLALRHIAGRRDYEQMLASAPESSPGGLQYSLVEYEARMELVLAAADLVVCRSGATTVAELADTGTPSLLVPLPGAPGDHQTANANYLAAAGAATVIPDREFDGERLVQEASAVVADPGRLDAMSKAALSCARRDAAERVADLLEANAGVVGGRRG